MQGQQGWRGWGVDWDGGDVPSLILASIISGFLSAYTCTTTRMPPIIFFCNPHCWHETTIKHGIGRLHKITKSFFQRLPSFGGVLQRDISGGHLETKSSLFNIISDHQLRLIIRHQAFSRAVLGFYFHLACRCAIVGLFITRNDMTFEIPCNFFIDLGQI